MLKMVEDYTIEDICKLKNKSDSEIIDAIGMEYLPLIVFVFEKKYSGCVNFIDIGGDCMMRYGSTNVANMSYLATHLHFLEIENDLFTLEGNISLPKSFKDRCKHFIQLNNKEIPLELYDAYLDQTIEGETYESRSAFKISFHMSEFINDLSDELSISFVVYTDGIRSVCGKINSYRFMPVADVIPNQYAVLENYMIRVSGNVLCIKPVDEKTLKDAEKLFSESVKGILKDHEKYEEVIELRKKRIFDKNQSPKVWIFMDRLYRADDNGEVFFRYVVENAPTDVECYFIIDEKCEDYKRLQSIGNVVPAFSYKHKELVLKAEYIFSSQMNGFVENPFGELVEFYRDLYHRARFVFLQHGVTKDDQSSWLHVFNHNIFAILTSSNKERDEFSRKEYGFKEDRIWNIGMPRFDELYSNNKKQILIIPTWRKSLMELRPQDDQKSSKWVLRGDEEDKIYFSTYKSLLRSRTLRLIAFLYGYKVVFVPHPLLKEYTYLFSVPKWIKQYSDDTSYKEIFAESSIMITDYSSVFFDFALLRKPVIYYQFDEKQFYMNHTYKKGYFNYSEDGFGPIAINSKQLISFLWKAVSRKCIMDDTHMSRVDLFFDYEKKKRCCQTLLEKIELSSI